MIIKTDHGIKKTPVRRNIWSESYLPLLLYINWSTTKNYLTKTLLEMTDSTFPRFFLLESIIPKSVSIGNFFVLVGNCFVMLTLNFGPVCANRSIPKKFQIKKISERTVSSIKNLGQVESVISKCVWIRTFFVMDQFQFLYHGNRR
jgi:hypothetical protein